MSSSLLDTTDPRPVHFIGIAGAGMSALAELLVRRGVSVQGTDANPAGAPDLTALGVHVAAHDRELVRAARAVVYSSAIPATHPEMIAGRELGLPVIRRAEALAQVVSGGTLVGIAGTHGKTTTTVMATEALDAAGLSPIGVVGGRVGSWEGNLKWANTDIASSTYVVESDEYDRSFLALSPDVAVVLNVEADHLDIYKDLDDIKQAFEQFLSSAKFVIRCADDEGAMSLKLAAEQTEMGYSATAPGDAPSVGAAHARLVASDIVMAANGSHFTLNLDGEVIGSVHLAVPGLHNIRNAIGAIGAGLCLGKSVNAMAPGLTNFHGVERRFQRLGRVGTIDVVDDYAHHPTEVRATLAAARHAFPGRRLVVVFQPHLYSRTRDLHAEFASALSAADALYLCDIYGARETPDPLVTAALIGDLVPTNVLKWTGPRTLAAAEVGLALLPGDVVLTMGAGDVTMVSPVLLRAMQA